MVKIISEGQDPQDVEHEIKCRRCKTVFSFVAREAKFNADYRDGDYLSIACPKCGYICTKQAN